MKILSSILLIIGLSIIACQPKHEMAFKSNAEDAAMVKAIFDEVMENGKVYEDLRSLTHDVGNRISGSENYNKAVSWSKEKMESYGFDNVFLQDVMVPKWVRGEKETVTVMADGGNVSLKALAIGGSVATPKNGITAEVIQMNSIDDLKTFGEDKIKGKIVFFNGKFDNKNLNTGKSYGETGGQRFVGAYEAEKFGAVAVVLRALSSKADDFPHTGGMRYEKDGNNIPSVSLSYLGADQLSSILEKNNKTKLKLVVNSKWYDDVPTHSVIGELKGSEFPDQYIVVGGHLDSWDVGQGAHDDGAGCTQSIEVLRTLKALGYKPRYTIRAVMFANEENGTRGGQKYMEVAKEKNEKHIAAMESDAGGFSPRGFGLSGSDEQLELMRNWLTYFDEVTINYIKKGGGGADIGPLGKELGVPTIGLLPDEQRYFDFHHTDNDLFENVNKRELELGAASMASMIYLIDKSGFKASDK